MAFNSLWLIMTCGGDRQQCFEVSFCLGWLRWFPGKSYKRIWGYHANGYGSPSILKDKQMHLDTHAMLCWTPGPPHKMVTCSTFLLQLWYSRKATKFVFHAIHSNNRYIFAALMEAFEWAAPQNRKFSQVDLCSNKHLSSVFQIHWKQCQMLYHPTHPTLT